MKYVVLSTLPPTRTYERLNITPCEGGGIHLVRYPNTLMWICHASPINRRLAVPLVEHADAVVMLYDPTSIQSMLRARQWKGQCKVTIHNTVPTSIRSAFDL